MLQISQVVSKAEAMFHAFNKHFYNGELLMPAITVIPDGGRGALSLATFLLIYTITRASACFVRWPA